MKANSDIITLILQSVFFELACLPVRDVLYEVLQLLKHMGCPRHRFFYGYTALSDSLLI